MSKVIEARMLRIPKALAATPSEESVKKVAHAPKLPLKIAAMIMKKMWKDLIDMGGREVWVMGVYSVIITLSLFSTGLMD